MRRRTLDRVLDLVNDREGGRGAARAHGTRGRASHRRWLRDFLAAVPKLRAVAPRSVHRDSARGRPVSTWSRSTATTLPRPAMSHAPRWDRGEGAFATRSLFVHN